MPISGNALGKVDNLKYLEFFVQKKGGIDEDVKHRFKCGLMKWREASGVLNDNRISKRLKDQFYKSVEKTI